jgi:hypothetical protein
MDNPRRRLRRWLVSALVLTTTATARPSSTADNCGVPAISRT